MEKKTKEEALSECSAHYPDLLMGTLFNEECVTPKEALKAMQIYHDQFKDERQKEGDDWVKNQNAMYNTESGEQSPEAARHHLSPVDSLKNFDVLLRAYMDRKLHEAGVRMPNEFWETIQKDEAIEYLKIPISEHPSSLTVQLLKDDKFTEWCRTNFYIHVSGDNWFRDIDTWPTAARITSDELQKQFLAGKSSDQCPETYNHNNPVVIHEIPGEEDRPSLRGDAVEFAEWLREEEYSPCDKSGITTWMQFGSKTGWLQPGASIVKTTQQLYSLYKQSK